MSGTLPREVRATFKSKQQDLIVKTECTSAEKLMPCGMRYPEPFRARPNFFIPILAVSSYVLPFFMLMFMSQNLHIVPFAFWIIQFLNKHIGQIYVPQGIPYALLALFLLSMPMLAGGSIAYTLSKNSKLSLKQKVLIWFVPMFFLVTLEVFAGTFLTIQNPNYAREIDSAHH